jgi:hypothetical protein
LKVQVQRLKFMLGVESARGRRLKFGEHLDSVGVCACVLKSERLVGSSMVSSFCNALLARGRGLWYCVSSTKKRRKEKERKRKRKRSKAPWFRSNSSKHVCSKWGYRDYAHARRLAAT